MIIVDLAVVSSPRFSKHPGSTAGSGALNARIYA